MLNSAPRSGGKYHQGLFIPENKEKLIKANGKGGVYYRSGLEHKFMIYLDRNSNVQRWCSELIRIPYMMNKWDSTKQDTTKSEHGYYPDFYYEMIGRDGNLSRVVVEIKPSSETQPPILKENYTSNQLKNYEYALKMYAKNMDKWRHAIEYCQRKGFEFVVITEEQINGKKTSKKV